MSRADDLARIAAALERAEAVLERFSPGEIEHRLKAHGDPVTEADEAVNDALLQTLPRDGEGWLSEETVDDATRLGCARTWIVDPLDGTKEFVQGIPEWCVSIGLVEDGEAVAGGIAVPGTGQVMVGALGHGVRLNGRPVSVDRRQGVEGAVVLASRSEVNRGEWERFRESPFDVRPTGSVAFKMACVAVGLADATWTLVPKNEWDVAGGTALVRAAGGEVMTLRGRRPRFNRPATLFDGLVATVALQGVPAWDGFRDAMLAPWASEPGGDA